MSKHPSLTAGESAVTSKRVMAGSVTPEAAKELASQNPFAVFTEWTGEADENAYANL
jgi:hypothetical protein